jgi:hypothetical protein
VPLVFFVYQSGYFGNEMNCDFLLFFYGSLILNCMFWLCRWMGWMEWMDGENGLEFCGWIIILRVI